MSIPSVFSRTLMCLVLASPAVAQDDLSVDDIVDLFAKQADLFREAEESPLGQTRGLRLVTIKDVPVESGTGEDVAATEAEASGVTITTDTTSQETARAEVIPASGPSPTTFGQLDEALQINLNIAFGFDSAALAETEVPKLTKMCAAMQISGVSLFRIVGHTDTSGSEDYNERLSILRANEVARHLVEECGIAPDRLETVGMGERTPYNTDNPRADENRRVEFQALS